MNNRGSALLEAVVTAPALVAVIGSALTALYLGFAKYWIADCNHQMVICLEERRPESVCTQKLRQGLKLLPFGETRISRRGGSAVAVQFRMGFAQWRDNQEFTSPGGP